MLRALRRTSDRGSVFSFASQLSSAWSVGVVSLHFKTSALNFLTQSCLRGENFVGHNMPLLRISVPHGFEFEALFQIKCFSLKAPER